MNNILVVDDSEELLETFTFIFQKHDFNVHAASSIDKMNDLLQEQIPDLILMDVVMSGDDGRSICKDLKTRNALKDVPVILMSASPKKLKNYKLYNADDILEKPFGIKDLFSKTNMLLQKKNM